MSTATILSDTGSHVHALDRTKFDAVYDTSIARSGFFEADSYYAIEKERYWRTLQLMAELQLPSQAKLLEIGGGQIALLRKRLLNDDTAVADISEKFNAPIISEGIPFHTLDLNNPVIGSFRDRYDAIVLLEVIEHIPKPAYIIIEQIKGLLKQDGILFLTTPNLFRLRNLFRMVAGIEIVDRFMAPEPGQPMGHQLEYSADHLRWQIERAGMDIVMLRHDQLGRTGHSAKARVARALLSPLYLRPIWREGLVAAARLSRR